MFYGACILICEDEPFIGIDLAISVEEAGGRALGPAATVKEALALLKENTVNGAILDVNLIDGDVTPVADALIERGIPAVVQTGVGLPPALEQRVPPLPTFLKPVLPKALFEELQRG